VVKKIKFGPEIFYGNKPESVPYVELLPLSDDIVASYTGPGSGLAYAEGYTDNEHYTHLVAGVKDWTLREEQAYGASISLYEQHPISGRISGEPIADSFALCVRRNNAILMMADGVNWGEKSRLAARCALYGSMKYLNYTIFDRRHKPENTQDVVRLLRKALDEAHRAIISKEAGLTTLCLCMVCEVANSDQHAVCCVNVGDSLAFVYSANNAIREVTVGSHDVGSERDIRDAGGALGPVDGVNPELHNLTCSVTFCHKGDMVFLTTDGISDNFDPVVTKIALPTRANDSNFNTKECMTSNSNLVIKPEMTPKERHTYAMKEMEKVVHEFELSTEDRCSAQAFCGALLQHVLTLTDTKRKIAENPAIYAKHKTTKQERKRRDSEIVEKMSKAPGKLDHASVIAVEVGAFLRQGGQSQMKEANNAAVTSSLTGSQPRNVPDSPPTPTHLPLCGSIPPSYHFKKSGARKFFAKLKSLPTSPTSHNPPPLPSSASCEPIRTSSSPALNLPSSPPVFNCTPFFPTSFSSNTIGHDSQKLPQECFLNLPPPKFPNRRFPKAADVHTPTSPTIMESPLELDITRFPHRSQLRPSC
ncbi:unnamed protein product, partial [Candidula unifasciata]